MKVFYVLAFFSASAVLAQIDLPPGVSEGNLLKQSCFDYEKGKAIAATAENCADVANYDFIDGPRDGIGLKEKFGKLIKGVLCFLRANNVRDEQAGIKTDDLKKALLSVATSQEKGDAYNAVIDGCNKDKLAIVPITKQLELLLCVLSTAQEKGICKPQTSK